MMSCCIMLCPSSYAYFNGPKSYGKSVQKTDKTFAYYEFEKFYGTHDWVADSALRLLLDHPMYGGNFTWILREDPYQNAAMPNDDIPFNDFDSWGIIPTSASNARTRKWVYNEYITIGAQTQRCLDKDSECYTARKGGIKAGRKWLHAIRYTSLLHGTVIPDYSSNAVDKQGANYFKNYNINIGRVYLTKRVSNQLPRERVSRKTNSITSKHKVLFDLKGKFVPIYGTPSKGADCAKYAGEEAVYFLDFEQEKVIKQSYEKHQPKYIAASVMLGILSHYICDLASPGHVLDNKTGVVKFHYTLPIHKAWEKWFSDYTLFSTNTFSNGGPDWSTGPTGTGIDPRRVEDGYPNGLRRADLFPLHPWYAAVEMSHITFTGFDPENGGDPIPTHFPYQVSDLGDHAAINMHLDPKGNGVNGKEDKWGRTLLKWAVYYTACAYLWVMKQVGDHNHRIGDTNTDISNAFLDSGAHSSTNHISQFDPLEGDAWAEKYDSHIWEPQGPHYSPNYQGIAQGMAMSVGLLVPTLAFILIPVAFLGIKKTWQEGKKSK
ncbi:MAG: hypothetical protein ACFFAN_05195 [Promethearchaeota archaeon]